MYVWHCTCGIFSCKHTQPLEASKVLRSAVEWVHVHCWCKGHTQGTLHAKYSPMGIFSNSVEIVYKGKLHPLQVSVCNLQGKLIVLWGHESCLQASQQCRKYPHQWVVCLSQGHHETPMQLACHSRVRSSCFTRDKISSWGMEVYLRGSLILSYPWQPIPLCTQQ